MSLFSRIRRMLWQDSQIRSGDAPAPAGAAPESRTQTAAPTTPLPAEAGPQCSAEEQELDRMIQSLSTEPDVATHVEHLVSQLADEGRSRAAVARLLQLTALQPDALETARLELLLAELLHDLKDFSAAMDLLQRLAVGHYAARAHFLLGDIHGREGNNAAALKHYESVLALDFRYPRARGRADDLRRRLDRPVATAAPTIFGADEAGPGGRFVLQREIGRGGGGTVYLALDHTLGRQVAVKVLHPHVARRQEARVHLFGEARIAAALQHNRIVTIYDLEESLNLVVMEYCAGGALADRIVPDLPMRPTHALTRLQEITSVLDTVHRCGVIHRDLKPGNLLLRWNREIDNPLVLTDFGIAHASGVQEEGQQAVGSLIYTAPEQRRGAALDVRADLYACGVILLEMLLGRPPLSHQQAIAGTPLMELDETWRMLDETLSANLARPLAAFCRSLVNPDVDRRPADAREVTRAASMLARQYAELELRQQVLTELTRRAGPSPSDHILRWLQRHTPDIPDIIDSADHGGD